MDFVFALAGLGGGLMIGLAINWERFVRLDQLKVGRVYRTCGKPVWFGDECYTLVTDEEGRKYPLLSRHALPPVWHLKRRWNGERYPEAVGNCSAGISQRV